MSGWRHAGENLAQVLEHRAAELSPPIQMCDALSRNTCGVTDSILANCLRHGRRAFVPLASSFPEQVRFVVEQIREVYRFDAQAKELPSRHPIRTGRHSNSTILNSLNSHDL